MPSIHVLNLVVFRLFEHGCTMAADASRISPLGRLRLPWAARRMDSINGWLRLVSIAPWNCIYPNSLDPKALFLRGYGIYFKKNRSRFCLTDVRCWLVHGRPLPDFIQGARESSMEIKKLEVSIERKPSIEIDSDASLHHHIGFD